MQSIRFNSNIYYRFPICCNTSTHNGCHPLYYIVTALIQDIISTTLQLIKEENEANNYKDIDRNIKPGENTIQDILP